MILAEAFVNGAQQSAWDSTAAALERKAAEFDLNEHLIDSVRLRLINSQENERTLSHNRPAFILKMDLYRFGFRPATSGYGLEAAVQLQLVEEKSGDVVWRDDYVYSCATAQALARHEHLVVSGSAHSLSFYQQSAGHEFFALELQRVADGLSGQIVSHFKAAGFEIRDN